MGKSLFGIQESGVFVIWESSDNPLTNLAKEEKIFFLVESGDLPATVRFWVNRECLIKGRVRSVRYGWYNEDLATVLGVPVYERSTGGGVVYQDHGNLNWSFFTKTDRKFLPPKMVFHEVSKFVVEGLRRLGVNAYFSPPNRIEVDGFKLSGMAARMTTDTLLVHGTLLVDSNLDRLNLLCIPPPGSPPVANLTRWKRTITIDEIIQSIIYSLRRCATNLIIVGS
jgi:lipoate-protein ligase A